MELRLCQMFIVTYTISALTPVPVCVQDPMEGMRRASRDPGYMFLTDESFFESVMAKERVAFKCNLVRAKEPFMHMMYGFPFQKDSPYLADITDR